MLVELGESLKLLESLQGDLAKTEAQNPLIHEQIAILLKCEVPVEEAVSSSLMNRNMHTYRANNAYSRTSFNHRLRFVKWYWMLTASSVDIL